MDVGDFRRLIAGYDENNIIYDDEPPESHFSMRCEENSITKEWVTKTLLDPKSNLVRIVEDRPKVYKLYFRLSNTRELKIVIDLFEYKKINLRTVKILNSKYKIGTIKRRLRY